MINKKADINLDAVLEQLGIDLTQVSLDSDGNIPILGCNFQRVLRVYAEWLIYYNRKFGLETTQDDDYIKAELERSVKEGALIYGIDNLGKTGKICDLASGLALPSIVYCLLGGQGITAVESEKQTVEKAIGLAKMLQVRNVEFRLGDVSNLVAKITGQDLVFVSGPESSVGDLVMNALGRPINQLILSANFDKEFESKYITTLPERGFTFVRFPLLRRNIPHYAPKHFESLVYYIIEKTEQDKQQKV